MVGADKAYNDESVYFEPLGEGEAKQVENVKAEIGYNMP